jgi:hypothetical protein
MVYLALLGGIVGLVLLFYVKYLRADRDLIKNDLDLYQNLHKVEVDHVRKLEKALENEERKARDEYYADKNPSALDVANRLRARLKASKTRSL